MSLHAPFVPAAALAILLTATCEAAASALPDWASGTISRVCTAYRDGARPDAEHLASLIERPIVEASIERNDAQLVRSRFVDDTGFAVSVTASLPGEDRQRVLLVGSERRRGALVPVFMVVAGADCRPASAETMLFDGDGRPDRIMHLTGHDLEVQSVELLNPRVPDGTDPGGVRVAHVDTGVAYDLPGIASRLARDSEGTILGYDFADDDRRPYDRDPAQPALFARQQGTGVASILLAEASEASLIPFRVPADSADTLAKLPGAAADRDARLVMMPMGGYEEELWRPFAEQVAAHPDILFIISAGNDGRDISADPVYPARFAHENMLVVTSTETDGHLARGANWGAGVVDIAVPAERIEILSPTGTTALGSGPSYAVPRVAALAARLLHQSPEMSGAELKRRIVALAEPLPTVDSRAVTYGWIRDPLR